MKRKGKRWHTKTITTLTMLANLFFEGRFANILFLFFFFLGQSGSNQIAQN